jgi:hypothetical protein
MNQGINLKSKKILITAEVIRSYINSHHSSGVSRMMLEKYISKRLRVVTIGGKLHAHADNIDEFFRQIIKVQNTKDIFPD